MELLDRKCRDAMAEAQHAAVNGPPMQTSDEGKRWSDLSEAYHLARCTNEDGDLLGSDNQIIKEAYMEVIAPKRRR